VVKFDREEELMSCM